MKILVELAYLHSPHFHIAGATGKNLGDRLDTRDKRYPSMKLEYDRDDKELCVTVDGRDAYIPESNVKSYFPFVEEKKVKPIKAVVPPGPVKAQVETPQDHVFAGPGGGKTK